MPHNTNLFALILCFTLLSACSDNKEQKENKTETVFQGQIDALHKAQTVEDTLLKANQQQREKIETESR